LGRLSLDQACLGAGTAVGGSRKVAKIAKIAKIARRGEGIGLRSGGERVVENAWMAV